MAASVFFITTGFALLYNYVMEPTISVCMIAKNEEKYLENCLASIAGKVNEIILVDTGSTDQTIPIANKYDVKVSQVAWQDDFSFARNHSIRQAVSDWILVLDADEIIDSEQLSKLKQTLSADKDTVAYLVTMRNYLPADELVPYRDHTTIRVFRNLQAIYFEGKVHESVQPSIAHINGVIKESDVIIQHYGYAHYRVQGNKSRGERNLQLILQVLEEQPRDAYYHYQAGITYKHLNDLPLAKQHLRKALSYNNNTLPEIVMDEILMKLAQIASLEKQEQACIKYALASLEHNSDNIISKYLLALCYASMGKFAKAYPYLLEIQQSPHTKLTSQEDLLVLIKYCEQVLGK